MNIMWETVIKFLQINWLDVLLVLVGASALLIYWLQERRKISEAASLIVMQVEDLQKRIPEIGSYIVNQQLNDTAFYESQPIFKIDYWNNYKHYFIRKMDSFSFGLFDEFYNCASEILAQQDLMKTMQKNYFYLTQQAIGQMEVTMILQTLATYEANNKNTDLGAFWSIYNNHRNDMFNAVNQKALDFYIPLQIRITLENALKRYNSVQIIGCEGYKKLKMLSQRKF